MQQATTGSKQAWAADFQVANGGRRASRSSSTSRPSPSVSTRCSPAAKPTPSTRSADSTTAPALPRADSHHGTRRVGHHAGGHAAEQRPDEPRLAMGAHHDHHGVTPTRRPEDLLVRQTRDQMRSDLGPMSRASKSAYGVAHIASAFLSGGRTRMSPRNPPMKADEIRSLLEHPYAPVRPWRYSSFGVIPLRTRRWRDAGHRS